MNGLVEDRERGSRRFVAGEDPRKRAQILAGAYRVFLRMGYDAASMNDITREAGVSKGTVYVYFRNKEELFEALLEQESERQLGELSLALDPAADVADALGEFGRQLARLSTRDDIVQVQRAIIAIAARMPDIARRYYGRGPQSVRDLLAAYLRSKARIGVLTLADPVTAAVQFIDLTVGQMVRERQYAVTETEPAPERVEAAVGSALDVFLAAYGAGAPQKA